MFFLVLLPVLGGLNVYFFRYFVKDKSFKSFFIIVYNSVLIICQNTQKVKSKTNLLSLFFYYRLQFCAYDLSKYPKSQQHYYDKLTFIIQTSQMSHCEF